MMMELLPGNNYNNSYNMETIVSSFACEVEYSYATLVPINIPLMYQQCAINM